MTVTITAIEVWPCGDGVIVHVEFTSPIVGFDVYDFESQPSWQSFVTMIGTLNHVA